MIAEILYRDFNGDKKIVSFETEDEAREFCFKRDKDDILYAVRYRGYLVYSNIISELQFDNLPIWYKLAAFFN